MTDASGIGPIKGTELLWEQVYHYLKEHMIQGHFPPGHKFPAESEMAKNLNVSRVSLREALQRLELKGLRHALDLGAESAPHHALEVRALGNARPAFARRQA